jgi:DNA repair protein RadC
MHPYPDRILPPSDPGVVDGESNDAPPGLVRLVRDGSGATASCPHCSGRLELSTVGTRWRARRPADVADRLVLQLGTLEREELHVLLLDTRCGVIGQERVYVGNVSAALVRIGELFTEAVRRNAASVLLAHCHPSGDPTPSPDDLHLTAEAVAVGRLLDIPVIDHLVIAGSAFVSLRERGVAFDGPGGRKRVGGAR